MTNEPEKRDTVVPSKLKPTLMFPRELAEAIHKKHPFKLPHRSVKDLSDSGKKMYDCYIADHKPDGLNDIMENDHPILKSRDLNKWPELSKVQRPCH